MRDFSPSKFILFDIIKVGIPSSMSMIIMAFGQLVFNRILVYFSTDSVAAYQVGGRVEMLIFLPIMGIASALTTMVGMFYCLLYTSPSPRDQRGSRMPSSA